MGILSDLEIYDLCQGDMPMISGVAGPLQITKSDDEVKIMGFGVDSYGYDARLSEKVEIFTAVNSNGEVFDPKRPTERGRMPGVIETNEEESWLVLPPGGFCLGYTPEYMRIPSDCIALVLGKSGYARNGIIVNPTVLKPGWEGQVVLEIHNATPVPVKIYVNEGIAHFIFIRGGQLCGYDYLARGGKYQGQQGIVPGRV